jgi:hypothetical protein
MPEGAEGVRRNGNARAFDRGLVQECGSVGTVRRAYLVSGRNGCDVLPVLLRAAQGVRRETKARAEKAGSNLLDATQNTLVRGIAHVVNLRGTQSIPTDRESAET